MSRVLAALVAVAVVSAGLIVGGPAPAQATDPRIGAPTVGECHDITIKQGYADVLRERPVSCSEDHTMEVVVQVHDVPAGVDMTDFEAVKKAVPGCSMRTIGSNPLRQALTLYWTFVFGPSRAQVAAGARWVSCHIVVWDRRGLQDLPETLPRATKRPADAVAKCLSADRKAVVCTTAHRYRAKAAEYVRVRGSNQVVDDRMSRIASRVCTPHAGRDGLYSWRRHSRTQAIVTCYRPTTR